MLHLLNGSTSSDASVVAGQEFVDCAVQEIEDLQIYPRRNSYRDLVLLGLLDRVVTTSQAVLCLVDQGFSDQAFGLSRTVIEAFFSLKYIENKDSESRAKRYLEYLGKDREKMLSLIAKHHPHLSNARPPDYDRLMEMAKQFPSPNKWYAEPSLKEVAYEKSTWALDIHGKPQDWEYTYDIVYKFASHEVHTTSVALELRIAEMLEYTNYPGAFRFSKRTNNSAGKNANVNACIHSYAAIDHTFHAFDQSISAKLQKGFDSWRGVIGLS